MNTATKIAKAQQLLATLSIKDLCKSFEDTNQYCNKAMPDHIPTLRGWLMDELERRNPEKFMEWLETENVSEMDYPSKFFL